MLWGASVFLVIFACSFRLVFTVDFLKSHLFLNSRSVYHPTIVFPSTLIDLGSFNFEPWLTTCVYVSPPFPVINTAVFLRNSNRNIVNGTAGAARRRNHSGERGSGGLGLFNTGPGPATTGALPEPGTDSGSIV